MPKIDGQAYIQRRIIWVDNCSECPYSRGNAIVPVCRGVKNTRKGLGKPRDLPNFYPKVPDWCPLDGADIC